MMGRGCGRDDVVVGCGFSREIGRFPQKMNRKSNKIGKSRRKPVKTEEN
jgi:hypothetical protein